MSEIFLSILNMSYVASYVIICVLVIRLVLQKSPKIISYLIWSVVAFRLVIPFSIEGAFSIIPISLDTKQISNTIEYQKPEIIVSDIDTLNTNASLPTVRQIPSESMNSERSFDNIQIFEMIGAIVWILGIVIIIGYSIISVLKLKKRLFGAILIEDNIYEVENLPTAFVFGIIKPEIYLPKNLSIEEKKYIIRHEQIHIKRKDHIIKIFAFLLVAVHWFNPFVWVSFVLMNRDMECSCDERVLKEQGGNIKKTYATSLVTLSSEKKAFMGPIAFGENNVRRRVKNVLNYKKPSFWVIGISIVVAIVLGIGLISNPINKKNEEYIKIAKVWAEALTNRDGEARYELRATESKNEEYIKIAKVWAEALANRDGEARYELMATESKEDYYNSLVDINGEENPWNIGFSSPYVISYEIEEDNDSVIITYLTATSVPENYIYQEQLFFVTKDKEAFVSRYKSTVNYLRKDLYEEALEIQKDIAQGEETWRLDPEAVVLDFAHNYLGLEEGEITSSIDDEFIYEDSNNQEIKVKIYRPLDFDDTKFLSVYEYSLDNIKYLAYNDFESLRYSFDGKESEEEKSSSDFVFSYDDEVLQDMYIYETLDYPLLAVLREDKLFLYEDRVNKRLILVNDGDIEYLSLGSLGYMTPRGILPKMHYEDFDNDNIKELLLVFYVASGTGVAIEEIHLIEVNNANTELYSFLHEDYVEKISEKFSYEIDNSINKALVKIEDKEGSFKLYYPAEKITFGDIALFQVIDDKIFLSVQLGIILNNSVGPQYYDENCVNFEVLYNDGRFSLVNPTFNREFQGEANNYTNDDYNYSLNFPDEIISSDNFTTDVDDTMGYIQNKYYYATFHPSTVNLTYIFEMFAINIYVKDYEEEMKGDIVGETDEYIYTFYVALAERAEQGLLEASMDEELYPRLSQYYPDIKKSFSVNK